MFSDIVDSTGAPRSSATAAGASCSRRLERASAASSQRFRGRAVKTMGDGFLATFDGPARAIRCALAIREVAGDQFGLEVRTGLHTGEIELIGEDVGGIAVHIGARVGARAAPARCSCPAPSRISSSAPGSRSRTAVSTSSRACRTLAAVGRHRLTTRRPSRSQTRPAPATTRAAGAGATLGVRSGY